MPAEPEQEKIETVEGVVWKIVHHCAGHGPGQRSVILLKGHPFRDAGPRECDPHSSDRELLIDLTKCNGCGRCISICPESANFFLGSYVETDRDRCIYCGKCVTVCPNEARGIVGRKVKAGRLVEEVADALEADCASGGISLGGGEPAMQSRFSTAVMMLARRRGMHTVLESTGIANPAVLKELVILADEIIFDLLHMDNECHLARTGVSNQSILENTARTVRDVPRDFPVHIRCPIVPGFNDNAEAIRQIAAFTAGLGRRVDLALVSWPWPDGGRHDFCSESEPDDSHGLEQLRAVAASEMEKQR